MREIFKSCQVPVGLAQIFTIFNVAPLMERTYKFRFPLLLQRYLGASRKLERPNNHFMHRNITGASSPRFSTSVSAYR